MKNGNCVELNTPFARVMILINEKDLWARDLIEEWILHNCGQATPKDIKETMNKFQAMRGKLNKRMGEEL